MASPIIVLVILGASTSIAADIKPLIIHATNKTSVPSVHYLVDAVQSLKEAIAIFDDPEDQVKTYAQLFQEKHSESGWNVVAGYTAAYISSKWYVEVSVDNGDSGKKDKEKKNSLYLIFSTDPPDSTPQTGPPKQ